MQQMLLLLLLLMMMMMMPQTAQILIYSEIVLSRLSRVLSDSCASDEPVHLRSSMILGALGSAAKASFKTTSS